ncbi:XRE family transcriptional regulator [Clostridium botulinum]|uniref:XRE family transcriptional regulator n=1 Tax=Clostridium botulinum TaxID=1491 RepID=A0A6M0ST67_CLOBO|nr:XRE family transcriptional regulator [Clostridium botulinum]NFO10957.1 helix-turn-helix transcriptional regulator [Clostridium botulinum]
MYENLRRIRNNKNISANQMCKLLGLVTKAAYYKKENGTVNFTLMEAKKVSDFFKLSIDEIFFTNHSS